MTSRGFLRKAARATYVLLTVGQLGYAGAKGAQLLSIRDVPITSIDYVWEINIEMHHGRILAACQVPSGWTLNIESRAETALEKEGGGHVAGKASVGHDALTTRSIDQLN